MLNHDLSATFEAMVECDRRANALYTELRHYFDDAFAKYPDFDGYRFFVDEAHAADGDYGLTLAGQRTDNVLELPPVEIHICATGNIAVHAEVDEDVREPGDAPSFNFLMDTRDKIADMAARVIYAVRKVEPTFDRYLGSVSKQESAYFEARNRKPIERAMAHRGPQGIGD